MYDYQWHFLQLIKVFPKVKIVLASVEGLDHL
jgi:hypothetical protein